MSVLGLALASVQGLRPAHVRIVADLTGSRNGQCGRLCDLFQVVAGDSAAEDDAPRMDGHLDAAQRPVTGGAQGALDAFGQAEVLLALLQEQGRPPGGVRLLTGALACGQDRQSRGLGHGPFLLLIR